MHLTVDASTGPVAEGGSAQWWLHSNGQDRSWSCKKNKQRAGRASDFSRRSRWQPAHLKSVAYKTKDALTGGLERSTRIETGIPRRS